MPVTVQTTANSYTGNGVTTTYAYTFRIIDAGQLKVYINGELRISGYTVTGVGNAGGGNVVFSPAPTNGSLVRLVRETALEREYDYEEAGGLSAATLDDDQDYQTMMVQEISNNSMQRNPGTGVWDAMGGRIKNVGEPIEATDAATAGYVNTQITNSLNGNLPDDFWDNINTPDIPPIGPGDFQEGVTPIEIVNELPTTGNFVGRIVFLTTDNKLYRWTGSGWTSAVPTVDLTGTINLNSQISGTLTEAFASAGLINANVVINADGTLSGAGGGQAQLNQLPGQIGVGQLAANSVTSASIAALSITSAKIAAGAVTADSLAANSVSSDKIQANAITSDKILANSIVAGKVAAGAIGASQINVTNLAAINADMGSIVAGTLTLNSTGHIKSGQTAYNSGTGFWLGKNGATTMFSLGSSSGNRLTWDGSTLNLTGTVQSSNYSAGTAGWQINAAGGAEFNTVTVRGDYIGTGTNTLRLTPSDPTYLMWAGNGTVNDDNAIMYVKQNGNAFFGGDIQDAFRPRAWARFYGSSNGCFFTRQFNMATITRIGTGNYQFTFTNALPNRYYCVTVTATRWGQPDNPLICGPYDIQTTGFKIRFKAANGDYRDVELGSVILFGSSEVVTEPPPGYDWEDDPWWGNLPPGTQIP